MQLAKVDSASVRMDSEEMASNALVSSFFYISWLNFTFSFLSSFWNTIKALYISLLRITLIAFIFWSLLFHFVHILLWKPSRIHAFQTHVEITGHVARDLMKASTARVQRDFSPLFAQVSDISFQIRGNNNDRLEISVIKTITGLLFGK